MLDTQKNKCMNRILVTTGRGFFETEYHCKEPSDDEIQVNSVMTGVCRSDLDMMMGKFGPLPLHMQGHEGLGQVCKIGKNITDISVGDYVATRGEPAYADTYNVRSREYVRVPEAHPRYILEPVACGVNVITQPLREIAERSGPGKRLLLLGSGFLAWVAYHTILLNHLDFEITVIGNSNKNIWQDKLSDIYYGKFDVVIDLSPHLDAFRDDILNNEALIVLGTQKQINTDFSNLLWKACTVVFPSPRTEKFYQAMKDAAYWVENGDINIDMFWTKSYYRDTAWQQAFNDGHLRPPGYSRGYIYWNKDGN